MSDETMAVRIARAREVMAEYGKSHDPDNDDTVQATPDRYLLVEVGTNVSPVWYSTHATPKEAGSYHLNQEYPEDWSIGTLVDLETGDRYDGWPGDIVWTRVTVTP